MFQKSLPSHRGLIESASILLVALSRNYAPSPSGDLLIRNLFRSIVFCEPDLKTLHHLSEFLVLISRDRTIECCNNLCQNETDNVFGYPRYNINRFSSETCPLQIFACLLQIAFNAYTSNQPEANQINTRNLLTTITIRLMTFLRNCVQRPVDWLFRHNVPDSVSNNVRVSYCYCYMVACTIVLLHMCIKEWVEDHSRIGK